MKSSRLSCVAAGINAAFLILVANLAGAAEPVVTAVPGDANNPTIQHPMIIGRAITLKGAVDEASVGANYTWDPGDASGLIMGVVAAPHWAVWEEHTYAGNAGDVFIATLTVDNGVDPVGTATFEMVARADTVPNRSNTAIAEALWYMHRNQRRFDGDVLGVEGLADSIIPMGSWSYSSFGGSLTVSVQGATLNAFEANGHREIGDASNPYTETVSRGLAYLFARLESEAIVPQIFGPLPPAVVRDDNPDSNGNDLGIRTDFRSVIGVSGNIDPPYQMGMVIDAIVASATTGTLTTTGPADVIGRSYGEIVQDMVDWYAMAQSDSPAYGGWRYGAYNNTTGQHDNSTNGWAATGLVAAEDVFGSTVPLWVKERNLIGLEFTDNESTIDSLTGTSSGTGGDGVHGYTNSPNPLWGPYGVTSAAMVQMSMNGLEATTSATPDERWVRAENFFRRNFDNPTGGNQLYRYYYAMFNLSKAMRTAKPTAVTIIGTQVGEAEVPPGVGCGPSPGCAADGPQPLDWYNDAAIGLAQRVIGYQSTTGADIGRFAPRSGVDGPFVSGESNQAKHIQPWGTQILTRTLAQAGPIAVGTVKPNPAGEGFPITLDHSGSFHQDPNRSLTLYEWDIDNDGTYDMSSPDANPDPALSVPGGFNCGGAPLPCSHILNLRVTDDADPPVSTSDIVILDLTIPPHAPSAIAGGPYMACDGETLTLDGSASFDLDAGNSESGMAPFDMITAYEWELDGVSPFDYAEAMGAMTDVSFATAGVKNIGLRVTDNTALAYPSSGAPAMNLTGTDNVQVIVSDCISADLAVTAAGSGDTIVPTQFTVTATISNGGPDDAILVRVVANLSNLVSIVSITPAQGSCAATGVVIGDQVQYECAIGDLAAGASIDIVVILDADAAGSANFEFTVDIDAGALVPLLDPDLSNNSFMATVILIDNVIIVIVGKGDGVGSIGALEILLLLAATGLVLLRRRRKIMGTTMTALISVSLLMLVTTVSTTAQAQDLIKKGFYLGGGIGYASVDVNSAEYAAGLTAAGYDVSGVTVGDDSFGWKVYAGYMFNEMIGVQASIIDLGELDSEYTASIPPDQIDDLLRVSTNLLPGRGRGLLTDVVLQYPFSERFALYGTLGLFFSEPETSQTVTSGGTGSASRVDGEQDFSASIGLNYAVGERASVKIGWERYRIDHETTDFPMIAIQFIFGDGS